MLKSERKQPTRSTWLLLLLWLAAAGAHAQDQRPTVDKVRRPDPNLTAMASRQPSNSIQVEVRYKKDLGYRSERGRTGPTSCDAFTVVAKLPGQERQPTPFQVSAEYNMREDSGYYVCDFLVKDLPLDVPLSVNARLSTERELPTELWKGGSQPQPPAGLRRVIQDPTRTVTLTPAKTRETLRFEMVYASPAT